jgi:hypothetical protein
VVQILYEQQASQGDAKPQPRLTTLTLFIDHSSLVKGANRAHSGALRRFFGRRRRLFEFEYRLDDRRGLDKKPDLI